MSRSKLSNGSSVPAKRVRWTLRALSSDPVLGSLPDATKRAIAATSRMTLAMTVASPSMRAGKWMPLPDACRRLRMSRARVMRRVERGELEALRIYGRWVVEVASRERVLGQ